MEKKIIDLVALGNFLAALKTNLTGSLTDLGTNVTDKTSLAKAIDAVANSLKSATDSALKVDGSDKILSEDTTTHLLSSTLKLDYSKTDKKIYLKGIDNEEISNISTDDFVVDGMLEDAGTVTALPSGTTGHSGETGPWLYFKLNTDGGSKTIYVDVSTLVDTYTSGTDKYIEVDGYKIKAKTASIASTNDGLVDAADVRTELGKKQNTIDGNNKLSASNIDGLATIATSGNLSDASDDTTHRLVTDTEKTTWDGKQDALVFGTAYNASTNKAATMSDIDTTITNDIATKNDVDALFT